MENAAAIDQVISRHLDDLRKPGVLSVRPGYKATHGWVTNKPAIVVTVEQKRNDLAPRDRLPPELEGYPVDVRQAGAFHTLRADNPDQHALAAAAARPEFKRPVFPYERDFSGQPLAAAEARGAAAAHHPAKPQVQYDPPAGTPLAAFQGNVTITCHASPDAGWPTLKEFLAGTQSTLTVGMYDFTSAHILNAVKSALAAKKLNLVLDHPAPNPSRDQSDEDTVRALQQALGSMKFAWALEGNDPKAAAWIFPNAYHIKVAVRDSAAFWLSSGNWNNSNQPDIDPVADPTGSKAVARKSDRDWHVIVQNPELAAVYEEYLLNDLRVAVGHQAGAARGPVAAAPTELAAAELAAVAPRAPSRYFPPKTITAGMKIQPLLTPDNYKDFILPLIRSAKTSFCMQTQYIHPAGNNGDQVISDLIGAVAGLIKAGVKVRLIMSQYETQDWLERIQDAGIDLSVVKVQSGVHNKGIVVDSKAVVVSSQNWSGDGVARNRDAGLIVYNEEAARYWQAIFDHDWDHMAQQVAAD